MSWWRAPEWLTSLRCNLPDDGAATVIVTGSDGARYLKLDKRDIDAYLSSLRRGRRRNAWLLAAGFSVLLGMTMHTKGVALWLDDALRERVQEMATLDAIIRDMSDVVPSVVTLAVEEERSTQLNVLASVIDDVRRRELVFRSYVDATGNFMQQDIETLTAKLDDAGFDLPLVWNRIARSRPAGGLAVDDRVADLFDEYIGEDIQALFDQRLQLYDFFEAIPNTRPMNGARITSDFGMRRHPINRRMDLHAGVDFVSADRNILAAGDGEVVFSGRNGGYGKMILLDHGFGLETLYAHMARLDVKVGDRVQAGDKLGLMGSTGLSTGPHLHFETRFNGEQLNPLKVLTAGKHVLEKEE